MSREAWGDEGPDDYGADRLLEQGWLTDEQAKTLHDAGQRWLRARHELIARHDLKGDLQMQHRAAEQDMEDALVEVFGTPEPWQGEPLPMTAQGVARMPDNDRAVLVMLYDRPTDDQLRVLHDYIGRIGELEARVGKLLQWKEEAIRMATELDSSNPAERDRGVEWWHAQTEEPVLKGGGCNSE